VRISTQSSGAGCGRFAPGETPKTAFQTSSEETRKVGRDLTACPPMARRITYWPEPTTSSRALACAVFENSRPRRSQQGRHFRVTAAGFLSGW